MIKKELVEQLAERTGLGKRESTDAINSIINCMAEALAKGEDIFLRGFGTFKVVQRQQKTGRDIRQGKAITIPPQRVIRFKPCVELKERAKK